MTVSCLTDDGLIDESDLREVMKACMVENGMQFDEKEVASLANKVLAPRFGDAGDALPAPSPPKTPSPSKAQLRADQAKKKGLDAPAGGVKK